MIALLTDSMNETAFLFVCIMFVCCFTRPQAASLAAFEERRVWDKVRRKLRSTVRHLLDLFKSKSTHSTYSGATCGKSIFAGDHSVTVATIGRAVGRVTHATSQAILVRARSVGDVADSVARLPTNTTRGRWGHFQSMEIVSRWSRDAANRSVDPELIIAHSSSRRN